MSGSLGMLLLVTVIRVIVMATGSVVLVQLPSFLEIVTFAGHTGKGDEHQEQGE